MFILRILKFTVLSAALSAVLLMILAVLSYATSLNEDILTIFVYSSVVLSVFLGALLCVKGAQGRALLLAVSVSALYYILLLCLTFVINRNITPNTHFITMTAGIFASGILGAVIGSRGK